MKTTTYTVTVETFPDGTKNTEWKNSKGELHREDGPAIEYADGTKEWWQNGKFHREDGPAIEWANGHKEWFLKGQKFTEAKFLKQIQKVAEVSPSCEGKIVEIDGKKYKLISC